MHGHGEKPYLCTFEGCDRAAAGNGFPRHWNMRDHMRRVHGIEQATPPAGDVQPSRGGRKRKAETQEPVPSKKIATISGVVPVKVDVETRDDSSKSHKEIRAAHDKLEATVKSLSEHLGDPSQPDFYKRLQTAGKCLQVLFEASKAIKNVPVKKQHQQGSG